MKLSEVPCALRILMYTTGNGPSTDLQSWENYGSVQEGVMPQTFQKTSGGEAGPIQTKGPFVMGLGILDTTSLACGAGMRIWPAAFVSAG